MEAGAVAKAEKIEKFVDGLSLCLFVCGGR